MSNSPTIAWIKDELGRYVFLSETCEKRFGLRFGDWKGKTDAEVWAPAAAAEFHKNDLAVLASGRAIEIVEETIDPDGGHTFWLSCKFPFRDGAGNRFVGGMGLDITERKRSEEALSTARRLEAVARLADGVAHDFNNMLHAIAGNLELALEDIGSDDLRDRIARALGVSHRGVALSRRVQSLSRTRTVKPKRVHLNERVEDIAGLLECTVGAQISVTKQLAGNLWLTLADPGEIDSAILNLAANSRDAMTAGGTIRIATSNITLSAQDVANLPGDAKPGHYVRLIVADDGPGMSEDVRANAMEPYFSTKGPGAGTGLGLSGVAHFAREAGGFVSVDSAHGQGCAVNIYLPRAPEEGADWTLDKADA